MTNTNPTIRTTHTRRTRRAALLVAPIMALGLAACGDDDTDDPPPAVTDPVTTDPVTTEPGTTEPDDMSMGFDETTIIGVPVDEAQATVEADDRQFRVAVLDGEDQALTADLVEGRVNVAVVDGVVTEVAFYG